MTKRLKRTPWFSGDVQPVREGAYESLYHAGGHAPFVEKDWWDGEVWRILEGGAVCSNQSRPWRGLTKEAK